MNISHIEVNIIIVVCVSEVHLCSISGQIQKEGTEETDDAVLHHSGSICDQMLGLTLRTFQK